MDWIGGKVFVVAEISANHKQEFNKAVDLVYAAHRAGADAVKVQMFTPDSLALKNDEPIKAGPWAGQTLYELYEKACMPYKWIPKLQFLAAKLGIKFFATVYDLEAVGIAEALDIEAYKIASYEADYIDLVKKVAQTKKPLIISAGNLGHNRLSTIYNLVRNYHKQLAFLKCTSEYPAKLEDLNLKTLLDMRRNFGCVGLSDHTDGIVAPVVAVSMGAKIIEKHLTLDNDTLDAGFSVFPDRFATMVATIRAAEQAIGKVYYGGRSNIVRMEVNGKSVRRAVQDEV
jgi:sialic acid synthase SpsE